MRTRTNAEIRAYVKAHPHLSYKWLAGILGVSKSRVHQIAPGKPRGKPWQVRYKCQKRGCPIWFRGTVTYRGEKAKYCSEHRRTR